MNNSDNEGNRGASIKPSARPSIHKHGNYCPFAIREVIMGRYGITQPNAQIDSSSGHSSQRWQGRDEVDNVMSKHVLSTSPTSFQNKKTTRRNSLVSHNKENATDSDNSHLFSKSLPTKFPSSSYCSNNSDEVEQNNSQTSNHSDISNRARKKNKRQNSEVRRNVNAFECPQNIEVESANDIISRRRQHLTEQIYNDIHEETNICRIPWPVIIIILGGVGVVLALNYNMYDFLNMSSLKNGLHTTNIYNKVQFYNDLSTLGENYKLDEDSMLKLQIGISSIFEKEDTGSFMFVYNSKTNNFKSTMFNDFVNEVAFISAKYLRNESTTVHHITIDSTKLIEQDPTELIENYSGDVNKGGVMLLREIDMLPPYLAMALHYYCDEYNPLVKKSAMFFTLDLAHCSQASEQKSTHARIEKCLSNKWNLVPADNIGPLLTRVVSVVVDVTSTF